MNIKKVSNIMAGQDGAIWNNYLFRMSDLGDCYVYDINDKSENPTLLTSFKMDKSDIIVPHANSVVFGAEYFCDGDEFPILYSNIYNNYANSEDPLRGTCCVYRIFRENGNLTSKLIQIIKIGFVEDTSLWRSSADKDDVRPYGNFVVDRENGIYYAFTMRDSSNQTRYFSFNLPKLSDGIYDDSYGVKVVILKFKDIVKHFDCEYHRYLQGACCHKGLIYSLEGFCHGSENIPALRIINPERESQILYREFYDFGLENEPEFIDFCGEVCYYGDGLGNLYNIEF